MKHLPSHSREGFTSPSRRPSCHGVHPPRIWWDGTGQPWAHDCTPRRSRNPHWCLKAMVTHATKSLGKNRTDKLHPKTSVGFRIGHRSWFARRIEKRHAFLSCWGRTFVFLGSFVDDSDHNRYCHHCLDQENKECLRNFPIKTIPNFEPRSIRNTTWVRKFNVRSFFFTKVMSCNWLRHGKPTVLLAQLVLLPRQPPGTSKRSRGPSCSKTPSVQVFSSTKSSDLKGRW